MEKKSKLTSEEMRIFKSVNAQTLTSLVQYEKLRELYNYDADNIEIIPPGVDVHRFKIPTKAELNAPTTLPKKYIFCLSRIDTNKGHDLLLKAFALVKEEVKDVDLVIGGGSPNPKPREQSVFDMMHKIIAEEKMENRVMFIGYVDDDKMAQYYQQSELFVLPSLFEPFGMTTQEAMACGKPVVASKFGGIRNVITHEKDGMLVDAANAQEFADAMIKILKNSDLKKSMGLAANELIMREYSWEAIADKFLDFYQKYE